MYETMSFISVHKRKHRSEQCHDQSVQIRFNTVIFNLLLVCTKIAIQPLV